MGKLYKRGDTYWADYWCAGQRIRQSLHTADRQVAKARLRDAELGTTGEASATPALVGHAIDEMIALKRASTAQSYKHKANHVLRLIGADVDLHSLNRADVARYVKQRLAEGTHRHTIHKELVVLRQAMKHVGIDPTSTVPAWKAEYEPRRRWLSTDEFAALLGAVDPKRRTWIMIQAYTGAELGAMRRLTWQHVNLKHGTIAIPGTKTSARHRERVPLHLDLAKHLAALDRTRPLIEPWSQVARHLREACARAKIKPAATTHDLRRTFGSWLVQAGVDILHVARLMGNSPAVAALVYGQTSDPSYSIAINKLPRVTKPKPRRPK